jgi:hypothetical protein
MSAARFRDRISSYRPVKTILCVAYILLGNLIVFGGLGCHKNTAATGQPQTIQEAVAQLQTALSSASPDVQSNLYHGVSHSIRNGDYAGASAALQQIASDPSLNQQQQAAVSNASNLLNQAIAASTNTPASN